MSTLEPLYEEYLKNTVEFYTGHSCFESSCKGTMEAPTNPDHLLSCNICGTGLKRTNFKNWIKGAYTGTGYTIETAEKEIEHNLLKIEELKKEIQELKEDNKENKTLIKNTKKRRKTISRKMREIA